MNKHWIIKILICIYIITTERKCFKQTYSRTKVVPRRVVLTFQRKITSLIPKKLCSMWQHSRVNRKQRSVVGLLPIASKSYLEVMLPTTRFQVTFFVVQIWITTPTECYLQIFLSKKIKPKHKAHGKSQKCKNPVHEFQTIFWADKLVNSNQNTVLGRSNSHTSYRIVNWWVDTGIMKNSKCKNTAYIRHDNDF